MWHRYWPSLFIAVFVGLSVPVSTGLVHALDQPISKGLPVGIFISKEIRPFIQMVEGLEAMLGLPSYRIFLDRKGNAYSTDSRFKELIPESFSAIVAVGPESLEYLVKHDWSGPIVYGMVLNPEAIFPENLLACGVSLNLSSREEFSSVHKTFPDIRRLGVLFDPSNNQAWFDKAKSEAAEEGIDLVPFLVTQQSNISLLFRKENLGVDAIMFIPDRTVISMTIIEYVIKNAILRRVPAIGYNRFFHDSGAAMSFIIDYRTVGKQVADQIKRILEGKPCEGVTPVYKILLNRRVSRKLDLRLGEKPPKTLEKD